MGLVSGRGGRERAVTPVSLPPTGICVGRRARRFTKGPAKSKRAAPAGCESIVSQCEHQFGNSLKANVLRSIRVRVSPVPRSGAARPDPGRGVPYYRCPAPTVIPNTKLATPATKHGRTMGRHALPATREATPRAYGRNGRAFFPQGRHEKRGAPRHPWIVPG